MQQGMRPFVSHIDLKLVATVGEYHPRSTLLDVQRTPGREIRKVLFQISFVSRLVTEQEQMNRLARLFDSKRAHQVALQLGHLFEQVRIIGQWEVGMAQKCT